jgi:hypothetical protein
VGSQFIFVVETNKKCQSDWMYIKDTIEHFYTFDGTQVKLSTVYMDGRGNYKKKEKDIQSLISQYKAASKKNQSKVIYCFDCDNFDTNAEDENFLKNAKQYCEENGYEFVWFCRDIEQVYIGKQVEKSQKRTEAATFKAKKLIINVNADKLLKKNYCVSASNFMNIMDQFEEFTRK